MPSQHAASDHAAGGKDRNQCEGAEAYPFDPKLRFESQRGLDRLRCIADRALAADFFAIFQAAERNTETALLAEREQAHREDAELKQLSRLATRALAGELGSDETQLATHLLLDERGRRATDLPALREFKRALIQLKRER